MAKHGAPRISPLAHLGRGKVCAPLTGRRAYEALTPYAGYRPAMHRHYLQWRAYAKLRRILAYLPIIRGGIRARICATQINTCTVRKFRLESVSWLSDWRLPQIGVAKCLRLKPKRCRNIRPSMASLRLAGSRWLLACRTIRQSRCL
jgi:hypothetical protein